MSNYKPLIYSLAIVFILGIVLKLVLTGFIDTTTVNPDSLVGNFPIYSLWVDFLQSDDFIYLYNTGWSFFGFEVKLPLINIFSLFGTTVNGFILEYLVTITYIPDIILIPLFILIFTALFYGLIKIFLP